MISRLQNLFTIKEFTGRHMLGVLFLFFGTIITVNMFLAWFAVNSWSGLVAKNGYVASIDFEAKQKDVARQNKLGWKSRLKLNGAHLVISFKDANGAPLSGLTMVGRVGRPTTEAQDQALTFHEANKGEYIAPVSLNKGQWDVDVTAVNDKNDRYRKIYRLVNKQGK